MADEMTIDERLKFLVTSTESLHASCQELHAAAVADREQTEEVARQAETNRAEMHKHQRALIAAIRAYLEAMGKE
jgi:hypothetical protein